MAHKNSELSLSTGLLTPAPRPPADPDPSPSPSPSPNALLYRSIHRSAHLLLLGRELGRFGSQLAHIGHVAGNGGAAHIGVGQAVGRASCRPRLLRHGSGVCETDLAWGATVRGTCGTAEAVRVPGTYSTRGPGGKPPAPPVPTRRGWLVRVDRTYPTEAPGRTRQLGTSPTPGGMPPRSAASATLPCTSPMPTSASVVTLPARIVLGELSLLTRVVRPGAAGCASSLSIARGFVSRLHSPQGYVK